MGKGPLPHARAIGLEDAVNLPDAVGCHAQPRAGPRTDRIGGGDERIGAEIHVEQRALSAFGQHAPSFAKHLVDDVLAVDDAVIPEVFDRREPLPLELRYVVSETERTQDSLVPAFGPLVAGPEVGFQQIADPQPVAAHLVRVGRPMPLPVVPIRWSPLAAS